MLHAARHYQDAVDKLAEGDEVHFSPNAQNRYDPSAIEVRSCDGLLGCVPIKAHGTGFSNTALISTALLQVREFREGKVAKRTAWPARPQAWGSKLVLSSTTQHMHCSCRRHRRRKTCSGRSCESREGARNVGTLPRAPSIPRTFRVRTMHGTYLVPGH